VTAGGQALPGSAGEVVEKLVAVILLAASYALLRLSRLFYRTAFSCLRLLLRFFCSFRHACSVGILSLVRSGLLYACCIRSCFLDCDP